MGEISVPCTIRRAEVATNGVRIDVGYLSGADETYHDLLIRLSNAVPSDSGTRPADGNTGDWEHRSRF